MTVIAVPPPHSDNLARRWFRTGRDHARSDAPSRHRSQPAIATFYDNLDQQTRLPLSARLVINRLEGFCAPALPPSASAKSP